MALVSCPECGRENVPNDAEACPICGYDIKAYFDKIKSDEKAERIKSVPPYKKNKLILPVIILILSIISLAAEITLVSFSDKMSALWFYAALYLFFSAVFCFLSLSLLCRRFNLYHLSKTNLEEYQRQVIEKQDAAEAAAMAREQANRDSADPYYFDFARNTTEAVDSETQYDREEKTPNPTKDATATALLTIGILCICGGILTAIIILGLCYNSHNYDMTGIAILSIIGSIVSGVLFIGFSKCVQFLSDIKQILLKNMPKDSPDDADNAIEKILFRKSEKSSNE